MTKAVLVPTKGLHQCRTKLIHLDKKDSFAVEMILREVGFRIVN